MLVAIDVGNTDVKLALVRDGRVLTVRRAPTRGTSGHHDVEGLLLDATGPHGMAGIDAIALVSVVPPWTEAVRDLAARLPAPLLVADAATIPITATVAHPERTGTDRLLNAYAVARLHGTPAIVVDLGTATTVDAVDAAGGFRGGAIAPGLELGLRALATGTARLPRVSLARPTRAIGRDTVEAIESGVVLGHAGVIRELIGRIAAELVPVGSPRPRTVLTGGLATAAPWGELTAAIDVVDRELTLRGLAVLHAELAATVAG